LPGQQVAPGKAQQIVPQQFSEQQPLSAPPAQHLFPAAQHWRLQQEPPEAQHVPKQQVRPDGQHTPPQQVPSQHVPLQHVCPDGQQLALQQVPSGQVDPFDLFA
jgi:hypothetical protein